MTVNGMMQAVVCADFSMKQARAQGGMAAKMEGKAGVLESEIEIDRGRGVNTKKKEEEFANLQAKVQNVTAAQISTLQEAKKVMEEAVKADQATEAVEKTDDVKEGVGSVSDDVAESGAAAATETQTAKIVQPVLRTPFDVRV